MSELHSAPDLLSNLAHEFAERYRRGERPALSEYTEQYPDLADQIRELFPALVMMEQFGSVAGEVPEGKAGGGNAASGAVPTQLGEYRILREIGRGGMGVVYEAVQETLGRHVALKVLPLHHLMAKTHLERFEREAKAAARLHHTNIVPVFGIGVHEGVHYYAMQFIQGQSLDTVLHEVRHLRGSGAAPSREPLTASIARGLVSGVLTVESLNDVEPRTSLATSPPMTAPASQPAGGQSELTGSSETRYFAGVARVGVQVAEALAYAHGQGMVHRDIKPSNLLLDTQGITWITDFGLVKDESGSDLTTPGDIVGTIRYMAPERFRDQGDARSDLYSLGATLYEMLTLKPAFPGEQRAELIDRVRHEEPRRPRQVDPRIPRDLETVVLKAMFKEPARRYPTASALAEDLRRFLADRPVLARRTTTTEQVWRWCRRNPTVAILTGSVMVLLTTLLIGTLVSNALLQERLDRAERAEKEKGEQLQRAERAEKEKTDLLWNSYVVTAQASRWSGRPGRRFDGLAAVHAAAAIRYDLRLRNEAIALLTLPDVRVACEIPDAIPTDSAAIAFDPALEHYARSDLHGNISVRRTADDQEVRRLEGPGTHAWHMQFSPDGRFLVAFYDRTGRQRVWEWRGARVVVDAPIAGYFDFSPDSALAALGTHEGIAIHELAGGTVIKHLKVGPFAKWGHSCWFHPEGKLLAVDSQEPRQLQIIEWQTGKVTATLPAAHVSWHPSGNQLVLTGEQGLTIWDARTWTAHKPLSTPDGTPSRACFSPRDDLLASGGQYDGRLRIWDLATGRQQLSLHGGFLDRPQFSRDGRLLAATRDGKTIHLWEVVGSRVYRFLRSPPATNDTTWTMDFSPDGRLLAAAGAGGMRLWDVSACREVAALPTGMCSGAVFAPDGRTLFTRSSAGVLRWPVHIEGGMLGIGPPALVSAIPFSAHRGTLVAAAGGKLAANVLHDETVMLLDPDSPAAAVTVHRHRDSTNQLSVSADGRWVATRSWWGQPDKLRVSDTRSGEVVWTHPLKRGGGEFSPDSRWLVTGDEACEIWETGTWRPVRTFDTPPGLGNILHAVFAPDGITLAIAHENRVVRLMDARSGHELALLPAPDLPLVTRLCFSADGSMLACAVEATGIQWWDLRGLRAELKDMGLDWDLPTYPLPADDAATRPLRAHVVNGPATSAPAPMVSAPERAQHIALTHRLALFEFLAALTPYHSEPLHQRGHTHEALGRHREALADFDAALVWQPGAAHLYYDRGRTHVALKEHGEAIRDFDTAVTLAPNLHVALNALAWIYATGPGTLRAPDKAVPLARRAVQLAPGNWSYRNTLGAALYRAGEFGAAIEILEKNSQDARNQALGFDLLLVAMSYHRRGDRQNARSCFDRAIAWRPPVRLSPTQMDEWTELRAEADALLMAK
jgi:serine/threonine protein kinase/WD40 repeat protein/Flp pilus assembly protein TadD